MNYVGYTCTSNAWEPIINKTVTYKCGCEVMIGNFLQHDAPFSCNTHAEGIKKIVTIEEYR